MVFFNNSVRSVANFNRLLGFATKSAIYSPALCSLSLSLNPCKPHIAGNRKDRNVDKGRMSGIIRYFFTLSSIFFLKVENLATLTTTARPSVGE